MPVEAPGQLQPGTAEARGLTNQHGHLLTPWKPGLRIFFFFFLKKMPVFLFFFFLADAASGRGLELNPVSRGFLRHALRKRVAPDSWPVARGKPSETKEAPKPGRVKRGNADIGSFLGSTHWFSAIR